MTKTGQPSDDQLETFKKGQPKPFTMTMSNGAPVYDKNNILSVGPRGPMLLQDVVYLDEMSHFDRERIPERVVHAKGAGAHGYLEITHDISKYCKAELFNKVGKQTPCFVRFSTVDLDVFEAKLSAVLSPNQWLERVGAFCNRTLPTFAL